MHLSVRRRQRDNIHDIFEIKFLTSLVLGSMLAQCRRQPKSWKSGIKTSLHVSMSPPTTERDLVISQAGPDSAVRPTHQTHYTYRYLPLMFALHIQMFTLNVCSTHTDVCPSCLICTEYCTTQHHTTASYLSDGYLILLAPQSGALRISAYGDFQSQSHPNPSTYSFRAFKPFYSDQKQCK